MENFNAVKEWWNQASVRDQLALVILGACLGLYILYAAVLKPVGEMRDKQLKSNAAQMAALERVRDLGAKWANRGGSGSGGGSLVNMVDDSLRKHSLRLNNMQPSGNNAVRLRLESVSFNSMIAWLNEMETQQRLQVKDLSISSSRDPGLVSVNMRLQRD